ncbi:uncharacterized protein LOC121389774 [Gigantopelta aegis]|uniref:uncharacterized protein LOC121389774 n=1 Tax=Gigantopelta aegis TaxID=1735272 RepID=UPI001B88D3B3|nr:uncharacterized protein LOC121389774 [Gigantopelta aegis]
MTSSYTIIDSVDRARTAVEELMKEDYVSIDAEGVNMSKTGPLTLLQVGKKDGHVFLFDVLTCPQIFKDGGLQDLLEGIQVLKVMHSSSNDSTSLKCQFDILLQNVFDTQVADRLIEENQGRQLPPKAKLLRSHYTDHFRVTVHSSRSTIVCEKYGVDVSSMKKKDDLGDKWTKADGEYWAHRPFTEEMTDYATADVRVLIPELYEEMKRRIELKGLTSLLKERTEEDLRYRWDDTVRGIQEARRIEVSTAILHQMETEYNQPLDLSDMENEDHKAVIKRMGMSEAKQYNRIIQDMKSNQIKQDIEAVKAEVDEKGDAYVPIEADLRILLHGKEHVDSRVHKLCETVLGKIDAILQKDMAIKYNLQTPPKHVSDLEKRFLRRLRSKTGETIPAVILRLKWLCAEESMDQRIKEFQENPSGVEINTGEHKKYKFFLSGPGVPWGLKQKAKSFLFELERAGKVQRPQPRRRQRHDYYDYDYDVLYDDYDY